jgi:hypothetical protein
MPSLPGLPITTERGFPSLPAPAHCRAFLQKTLEDWTAITNALDLRMDS